MIILMFTTGGGNSQEDYQLANLGEVQLHYKTKGDGVPLILIHGSLADLRYWTAQDSVFAEEYKVFMYSRRYNYPNTNSAISNHSAAVEARDLLAFMNKLNIYKANIVGHSYGALTALLFALDHPDRVKKMVLAEPPLLRLLPYIPNGQEIFDTYMTSSWNPMGKAFGESDEEGLEATSIWYFDTSFNEISPEWQTYFKDNLNEWKALTLSEDAFPAIDPDRIKDMETPTLLLSADQNQGIFFDLIDTELSRLLPQGQRKIIENSSHEMFIDNPEATNRAILEFLNQ